MERRLRWDVWGGTRAFAKVYIWDHLPCRCSQQHSTSAASWWWPWCLFSTPPLGYVSKFVGCMFRAKKLQPSCRAVRIGFFYGTLNSNSTEEADSSPDGKSITHVRSVIRFCSERTARIWLDWEQSEHHSPTSRLAPNIPPMRILRCAIKKILRLCRKRAQVSHRSVSGAVSRRRRFLI